MLYSKHDCLFRKGYLLLNAQELNTTIDSTNLFVESGNGLQNNLCAAVCCDDYLCPVWCQTALQ